MLYVFPQWLDSFKNLSEADCDGSYLRRGPIDLKEEHYYEAQMTRLNQHFSKCLVSQELWCCCGVEVLERYPR